MHKERLDEIINRLPKQDAEDLMDYLEQLMGMNPLIYILRQRNGKPTKIMWQDRMYNYDPTGDKTYSKIVKGKEEFRRITEKHQENKEGRNKQRLAKRGIIREDVRV